MLFFIAKTAVMLWIVVSLGWSAVVSIKHHDGFAPKPWFINLGSLLGFVWFLVDAVRIILQDLHH